MVRTPQGVEYNTHAICCTMVCNQMAYQKYNVAHWISGGDVDEMQQKMGHVTHKLVMVR